MTDDQIYVLKYILRQAKGRYEVDVIIEKPDEKVILGETFGRSIFALEFAGYMNGHKTSVNRKIDGLEIRQIIVNISRRAKEFEEGGIFLVDE